MFQVSLTTSTEDKDLVKNASQPFNRVASLDPVANQTGQNEEKSTKRNKLIAKTANRTGHNNSGGRNGTEKKNSTEVASLINLVDERADERS